MNKKILVLILFFAFLPAVIAGVWILNVTSSRFSSTNVSSVSFSLYNETPTVYTSKDDRDFFCNLRDGFQAISPQEINEDVHTLYQLDFLRIQGDVTYYLCLSADTKNCLAYDSYNRWYRIDKEKAEELLLRYNISDVYKYSCVPSLNILSEGVEYNYIPQSYNWNYLVADGTYTNVSNEDNKVKDEQLFVSSVKKIELYFDVIPDWYGVKIYQDDVIVYDGLLESFADFNYNVDANLRAVVTAEWYDSETNLYNGTAIYEFNFNYDIPASFSINKNEFSTGEVAYIYVSNANDETFSLSSDFLQSDIIAQRYGLGQLILLPIPMDVKTGEYTVELKSEHTSFNIPVLVNAKNYETVNVGLIRSETSTSYNTALSNLKKQIAPINDKTLFESEWVNGFLSPLKKYIDGKEQYWISAPSYGVFQKVGGTVIEERSFGIHYVKAIEADSLSVRAIGSGEIVYSSSTEAYGNTVIVEHGYGLKSVYGHLDSLNFNVGDKISMGDIISISKPKAFSIASNEFFFGVYVNGVFVNPFNFIEDPKRADASEISNYIDFLINK